MARASLGRQLVALLKRNVLLKRRNKKQTITEFILPIYFVLLLVGMRLAFRVAKLDPVESYPVITLSEFKTGDLDLLTKVLYVWPESPAVEQFTQDVLGLMGLPESRVNDAYRMFPNATQADVAYRENTDEVAAGVDLKNSNLNESYYAIRMTYQDIAKTDKMYDVQDWCREDDGLSPCDAVRYLTSGYAFLQTAIETAFIRLATGESNFTMSNVSVQQIPKPSFQPETTGFRTMAAVYFVMAYSPFISFLVINLVTEKEKKIKEAMRMMGMRDSAFWLAWAIVYVVVIFVVTLICVLISWGAQLYQNSNMFLFFLILFLYGLTIINLAFMLTPLFDKAETAGFLASMATIFFSLLYLPITLTRDGYGPEGPESSIPVWGQFLLCLLSPVAFALAIDQSLYLDSAHGGMTFDNMMVGEFPVAYSMIMLAVDFVLYGLLAVYMDKVIPSAYGQRQPPWFCFMPSYWMSHSTKQYTSGTVTPDHDEQQTEDIEPIPADLMGKDVVRISNITKVFKADKKKVVAVDGMSLDFYEGQITCILGHNGAGKTTLLNVLTGLTPATSGSASVYGLNVTDPNQMDEMRSMTGVCPQHNILFDVLTCREHLEFFAALKGVPASSRQTEIKQALEDVSLTDQADVHSEKLSGGQKRKLSVAIALIGDPRVIFLDEPTAGMDPFSRRHLWSLLKGRRPGRVIVLTTHFMDEADILADRKAFISKGKLKCVGSSLFLKNRFGVGYHLGMEVESYANIDHLTQLVTADVPTAELSRTHGKEVIYVLPLSAVESFPKLFGDLEATLHDTTRAKQLGLKHFGVSMTTLEEVFLKIGVEGEEDDDGEGDNQSHASAPLNDTAAAGGHSSQINLTVSEKSDPTNLTKRRFWALVKILFIIQLRRKGALAMRVIMPLVFIVCGMVLQKVIENPSSSSNSDPLTLQPGLYCKTTDSSTDGNPDFVYFLGSPGGTNDSGYVSQLVAQDLSLLHLNGSVDQLINTTSHMGHNINDVTVEPQTINSVITALYNDTAIHSMPIAINVIHNALLSLATGVTQNITAVSEPWPNLSEDVGWDSGIFFSVMLLGFGVAYIPAGLSLDVIFNRQYKIRSQLRISGVTANVYWNSLFFSHVVQFSVVSICSIIITLAFQLEAFMNAGAIVSLILIYIAYMPATLLLAYLVSFGFSKYETAQGIMMNVLGQYGFWPYMCVSMMDMMGAPDAAGIAHSILIVLSPPYAIFGGLYYICRLYSIESILQGSDPSIPFGAYFEWSNYIIITWVLPIQHAVIFNVLLRVVEVKSTGGDVKEACGCSPGEGSKGHVPEANDDLPANEDEDIVEERKRVENWDSTNPGKTPVVMVKNIRKEFTKDGARKGCKKTEDQVKVAVRNNSFAVEAGEVFGLLGPNGAGKTTALNLIIAEEGPTKGRVYVAGHDVRSSLSDAFQAMSYCPQHDALWEAVTVRQHIHCYATMRGIAKENVADVANYYMESLKIMEHADKMGQNLSGGTKRKLSYIISMLGEPQVVLLDEPSTGMDPRSKRFLWDTISAAFNNEERGAILTTHYMEEADALCSRVGIMVNGQLECLGTTQHLKSKYGTGYMLEIKLARSGAEAKSGSSRMDDLNTAVTSHFHVAVVSECFGDRASYKVPQDGVKSLSNTFKILEEGKTSLGIEEYSFSQSTLEQVFLLFAKQQLEEGAQDDPEQEVALNRTRSLLHSPSRQAGVPEDAVQTKPAGENKVSESEWL